MIVVFALGGLSLVLGGVDVLVGLDKMVSVLEGQYFEACAKVEPGQLV